MNWQKLPKVELHRHLDASLRFETILELAQKNNIPLKSTLRKDLVISEPMSDLETVLNAFWTQQKVLVNYEAIKRVAFENVEDAFREGIPLIELRFAPLFIQTGKSIANDEIIEGILDGITEGMEKYAVQVGLIHIMPRSLDLQKNLIATDEILRYRQSSHKNADRLVGIDLADLETEDSFKDYADSIAKAKSAGMGVTIHSGEDSSALHVKRTLEVFKASRIGHGVQIIKDEDIMKLVKDRDVVLEVCPTSNWLTNIVKDIKDHPLRALYDNGVKVTLNSDDPHIMNINLVHEYDVAVNKLGFQVHELVQMNKWALEKSFVNDDIKKELKKKFSEFR